MTPLGRRLADLSAREMVLALGLGGAPAVVRKGLSLPFFAASRTLGETLARLQQQVGPLGLPTAADRALERCGVTVRAAGGDRNLGPCVILANHPGAYDALALMRAIGRRDLLVLAADREFLRALSGLAPHFALVGDGPTQRARALKAALTWLRKGGALLHFPAGKIEPDADFEPEPSVWLAPWQPGVATLVAASKRVAGRVFVAGVRGVHSPRAKRSLVNQLAEHRGISTLSPLLQIVAGLRDVRARVRIEDASMASTEAELRRALVSAIDKA